MTSEAKIDANRRNAKKSTGPRTDAGKAMARFNAVRHGVLTAAPLLPGEDVAAWDQHTAGVVASLTPFGALEVALAERVALTLWRLQRFARAEALMAAADLSDAVLPKFPSPIEAHFPRPDNALTAVEAASRKVAKLKLGLVRAKKAARCLATLDAASDTDAARHALHAVRAVRRVAADFKWKGPKPSRDPRKLAGFADGEAWTAGRLRHALAVLTAGMDAKPGWLAAEALKQSRRRAEVFAGDWEDARANFAGLMERARTAPARRAAASLLPEADKAELMIRYESHLQKLLTTTLHELERLQAMRAGRLVVPPLAVDVTVTGPAALGSGEAE